MKVSSIRILGIRGIPAAHGGFETFAEKLAVYLTLRGWRVTVYCQEQGEGAVWHDVWQGVDRIHIPVSAPGPRGTIIFDWKATLHAASSGEPCLTLGYNTAAFTLLLRLKGIPNLINMDGIEWSRAKWGRFAKSWFWLNERAGCWLGTHLIADHPEIRAHLETRVSGKKITTIAYGADPVAEIDSSILERLGLSDVDFITVVARPEPENSLLEIVEAFSRRDRFVKLVVLGNYDSAVAYHRRVLGVASQEVMFVGAIYDKHVVETLRAASVLYVHGHQVGGTNPSLVESMAAGNAVIAHDNRFNRWVAGESALYFIDSDELSGLFDSVLTDQARLERMRSGSLARFESEFTWSRILGQYEELVGRYVRGGSAPA